MKKILNWITKYYLAIVLVMILLLGIYDIFLRIDNNKLKEQNTQLKEEIAALKVENEEQMETIIDRNQEIARLEMIAMDWQELFYAEIEFYPNEGYPYSDDYNFSTSCK